MLNLQDRINGVDEGKAYLGKRISIRDKLLAQGSTSPSFFCSHYCNIILYITLTRNEL